MANINEVLRDGDIFIEPRLQEYLNKKNYFEKNNIDPSFSLEKEYNITNEDKKLIKEHLKGNKNIYRFGNKDQYLDLIDTVGQKFPTSDFKQDERYQRFKKKMQRTKDAAKQRHNYSQWDDGFTKILPEEENKFMLNYPNNQKFNTPTRDDIYENQRIQNNMYDAPFNLPSKQCKIENQYSLSYGSNNYPNRNIKYNDQLQNKYITQESNFINQEYNQNYNYNQNVNKIIGNLNTYANNHTNSYQFAPEMDQETKIVKPSINNKGKSYYNTSRYQAMPYMGTKEGLRDIGIENNLRSGEEISNSNPNKYNITGKAKSSGYPNPQEHYFNYISDDFQKTVDFPFPQATRQNNHGVAKSQYKREIM